MNRYLRKVCFGVLGMGLLWFAFASDGFAQKQQSKPDMTGTWLLDVKKSNSVGVNNRPDLPIKISHQDPELRITLTSESKGQMVDRQFVYFTDGRGEDNEATAMLTTNPGGPPRDLQKERNRSTTRWRGNKIVTRASLQLQAGGRVVEFELIDEWKLSSDGKTLTQTTKTVYLQSSGGAFLPAMVPDKKRVYNRV